MLGPLCNQDEIPREAVVLVGGLGTRLKSVVADRPKPMADVAGRPFLEFVVRQLADQGFQRVVMCTGRLAEQVVDHFGSGAAWGLEVVYSHEAKPMGTGGAIHLARRLIEGSRFFVLNGDSFCLFEPMRLWQRHMELEAMVTIWLARVEDVSRFGRVEFSARGEILSFKEKAAAVHGAGYVNAGSYLLEAKVLSLISKGVNTSLERGLFPRLSKGSLAAVVGDSPLIDIGTPESYARAQKAGPHLL